MLGDCWGSALHIAVDSKKPIRQGTTQAWYCISVLAREGAKWLWVNRILSVATPLQTIRKTTEKHFGVKIRKYKTIFSIEPNSCSSTEFNQRTRIYEIDYYLLSPQFVFFGQTAEQSTNSSVNLVQGLLCATRLAVPALTLLGEFEPMPRQI